MARPESRHESLPGVLSIECDQLPPPPPAAWVASEIAGSRMIPSNAVVAMKRPPAVLTERRTHPVLERFQVLPPLGLKNMSVEVRLVASRRCEPASKTMDATLFTGKV